MRDEPMDLQQALALADEVSPDPARAHAALSCLRDELAVRTGGVLMFGEPPVETIVTEWITRLPACGVQVERLALRDYPDWAEHLAAILTRPREVATPGAGASIATGRISGYLPDARAVEVILDAAVPEWMTKLPSGVVLSASAAADQAAQPDPTLLRFYEVSDYPALVVAMEAHVLKLIDAHRRNVKPWEDTFPPTLLPKWIREQQPTATGTSFQAGVSAWMSECFATTVCTDITERGDRLLEEVLELLQSHGYDRARVPTLVGYVFGRPVGESAQEVGGVMVTLAAYCRAAGLDMHAEGARELARITEPEVMAKIRRKQAAKSALHFDTPLPGDAAQPPAQGLDDGDQHQQERAP